MKELKLVKMNTAAFPMWKQDGKWKQGPECESTEAAIEILELWDKENHQIDFPKRVKLVTECLSEVISVNNKMSHGMEAKP